MNQSKIEEIKKNILKEMERLESEKQKKQKNAEKDETKNRDLELAKNWQKRYIETKKKDGKTQISVFLVADNITGIDRFIVEQAKNGTKQNRSDIINEAVEFYLNNRNNKND